VLDDLFVLRQAAEADAAAAVHVYTPPAHAMGRPSNSGGGFEGENPSPDLPIYYHLASALDEGTALTIEYGTLMARIRHYSSEESDHDRCLLAAWIRAVRLRSYHPRGRQACSAGTGTCT
jgi:SAM-dependent MidA family methyltransferase